MYKHVHALGHTEFSSMLYTMIQLHNTFNANAYLIEDAMRRRYRALAFGAWRAVIRFAS